MRKPHAAHTLGSGFRRIGRWVALAPQLSARLPARLPARPVAWLPGLSRDPSIRGTGRWIPAAALVFLAVATLAGAPPADPDGASTSVIATADRGDHASRSRQTEGANPPTVQADVPKKAPEPARTAAAKPTKPAKPAKPVGWLNQAQMDNAAVIVKTGQKMRLPKRAYVIAVATAMQESRLLNLANPSVPNSLKLKSQGMGYDHDSVGLFQQRPSSGWGTPAELLDPETSAAKFYSALMQVPGWQGFSLTIAAQSVQVSAFPYAYAKHEALAQQIVDALTKK